MLVTARMNAGPSAKEASVKPDEGIETILHHFNDLQVKGQDLSEWRNGVWTKTVLSALCKAGGDHDFYVNASNVGDSGEWLFDACWSPIPPAPHRNISKRTPRTAPASAPQSRPPPQNQLRSQIGRLSAHRCAWRFRGRKRVHPFARGTSTATAPSRVCSQSNAAVPPPGMREISAGAVRKDEKGCE